MSGEWARDQAARTAQEVVDNLDKEIRYAKQEERRAAEERAAYVQWCNLAGHIYVRLSLASNYVENTSFLYTLSLTYSSDAC